VQLLYKLNQKVIAALKGQLVGGTNGLDQCRD
jgi:hypothetical protein